MLRLGGSAADAAVAANAVLTVTAPHLCGMGGDLFALVHRQDGPPAALNASGRAGSGANAQRLRAEGHTVMPLRGDVRAVTTPGCVDGWLALHSRFGRLALDEVLAPAASYAESGFGASPLLAKARAMVESSHGAEDLRAAVSPGDRVRRPGVARALRAVATAGREGFYLGEFGEGLTRLSEGEFTDADLAQDNSEWVDPLGTAAFGHDIWTVPPNSQGYLVLLGMAVAQRLEVPDDPADPLWAHLTVEAARQAGRDRAAVLSESADVASLLSEAEVARRAGAVSAHRAAAATSLTADGDTTYLCAVDSQGCGVSLIQSNASGFGSGLFEPATGIGLHNRGLGFSLQPGHPAEYAPGRRPPHTLAPVLVTDARGRLRAVAGTMGGDAQPQIMTQILIRLLHAGQSPGAAVAAPRWRLGSSTGFDTWTGEGAGRVELERAAPPGWDDLGARGHQVARGDDVFGHAHLIEIGHDGIRGGAADYRASIGGVAGH